MSEIVVNLSEQEYSVFDISQKKELVLKNKNFIFGKNGAGKSTLCKLVETQFTKTHNVFIFSGFENILIDNKLDAVVLGKENTQIQKTLLALEKQIDELYLKKEDKELLLKQLQWVGNYQEEEIEKHELLLEKERTCSDYQKKEREIDKYCKDQARILKSQDKPQITKPIYNKQDFIQDIPNKCMLTEEKKQEFEKILAEKAKEVVQKFSFPKFDLEGLLKETNSVLQKRVKETIIIEELKDEPDKQAFAKRGLEIHKETDSCAFCGNEITKARTEKLQSYFSVNEVRELEEEIQNLTDKISRNIINLNSINNIEEVLFYEKFLERVKNSKLEIKEKKAEYRLFFQQLENKLDEKARNLFGCVDIVLNEVPEPFSIYEEEINSIVEDNNNFTQNLSIEQDIAKTNLRLHYVAECLEQKSEYKENWIGYEGEQNLLHVLEGFKEAAENMVDSKILEITGDSDQTKDTLLFLESEITKKINEKKELLKETKDTSKSVDNINMKLKRTGKNNLELCLVKEEDKVEHYLIKDGEKVRDINKISTGEKNIIAFLYFLESLSDIEIQNSKPKIIILDDPMNSNDDTMQYLIITELQKLYQGSKYKDKFNLDKDIFVCLTHNAHFYINVQPHGNFKDKKLDKATGKIIEVSKYDKNNFYRIEDRNFRKIMSEKEDLNTHYEYLWIELAELYNRNLLNSMLNSMRRIIETYIKFNKINQVSFYENKEEHMKIFNVNSHSIDDLSAETIGKTKKELLSMFEQVFIDNKAEDHFKTYWRIES